MSSYTIDAAHVVCVDDADTIHSPGHVVVRNGDIVEVRSGRSSDPGAIDRTGHILLPGLVNAHTHTPMSLMRGVAEGHSLLTMDGWYDTIRTLELSMTPDMIAPAVALSLHEMLTTGTTTFADQYFFMDRAVPVVERSGMRGVLAYGIVELDDADARRRELDAAREFLLAGTHDSDRVTRWIGPHAFFVDNSPETIGLEVALAAEFGAGLHAHFSTHGEEDEVARAEFGSSAINVLAELGVLEHPLLAAHSLVIDAEDLPLLARSPSTLVMAATVCMVSGAPAPPMRQYLDAGINVAIGTDNVCNNGSYDMFEEMRTLSRLMSFREQRPTPVSAHEILRAATRSGASALGLDSGALEPGRPADMISLDLSALRRGPHRAQSITSMVVFGGHGGAVRDVIVGGDWLVESGQVTVDLAPGDSLAAVDELFAELSRAG